ncbi:hypothetical protein VTL71DRAFT_5593 [Oculimacula yallundae]|uniref:Heterokaryon incompatibility domain-containing protein n=1 Tax=Oculimacula yallundae TaxID=86028 RepID=A0ABR4C3Z6_9HELO
MHNFKTRLPWQTPRARKVKHKQRPLSTSSEDNAAAGHGTYQYSPIKKAGTIRLMRLQPSRDIDARIQCHLVNKTLKMCAADLTDHYVALSYVWGDATERKMVSIGLETLDITASLEFALRHIRDRTRVLFVWADGVCIDQSSVEDRNLQVSQMGVVYSTAKKTIIFLGPSSLERGIIMRNISKGKSWTRATDHPSSEEIVVNSDLSTYPDMFEKHIMNAAWFTRVWVLQELILSVDPWVQFGTHRVP